MEKKIKKLNKNPTKYLQSQKYYKSIRRACKLCIDFIHKKGKKIHFILSNILDQDAIMKKEGENGNSVTASELRKIHKNWNKLKQTVIFYKIDGTELKETPAPWEVSATKNREWELYASQRRIGKIYKNWNELKQTLTYYKQKEKEREIKKNPTHIFALGYFRLTNR